MTWTNAFDVGACTVKASRNDSVLHSEILAKGEESANFSSGVLDQMLKIAVSPTGAASLEQVSGYSYVDGFLLEVIPSYDISSSGIRVSAIDVLYSIGLVGTHAIADSASINPADSVALTHSSDGAWSPDPADLSAAPSKVSLSIYMGATPA